MDTIKEKTVILTGHTLTTATGLPDRNLKNVVRTELYYCLSDCCAEGKNRFLSRLASGFELLAGEVVVELKKKFADVRLVALVPADDREQLFTRAERLRYDMLLQVADERVVTRQGDDSKSACSVYGDLVIAGASEMIVYSNGQDTGTEAMMKKAQKKRMEMLNLFDELENYFALDHPVKRYLQDFSDVTSFRFGREGVLFHGYKQAIPVPFTEIASVTQKGRFLEFALKSGVTYKASIFTDECIVTQTKSRFEGN